MPKPSEIVAQLQRENAALKMAIVAFEKAWFGRGGASSLDAVDDAMTQMFLLAEIRQAETESVKK